MNTSRREPRAEQSEPVAPHASCPVAFQGELRNGGSGGGVSPGCVV